MSWDEVGMAGENIVTAMTVDQVMKQAGTEGVIGFGPDTPETTPADRIRPPAEGETMKYRIVQEIGIDAGGKIICGVGTEFTSDDVPYDVTNWVSMGYLVIVEDGAPRKLTKEVVAAPVEKRRGR
jgi:hypothetical protein